MDGYIGTAPLMVSETTALTPWHIRRHTITHAYTTPSLDLPESLKQQFLAHVTKCESDERLTNLCSTHTMYTCTRWCVHCLQRCGDCLRTDLIVFSQSPYTRHWPTTNNTIFSYQQLAYNKRTTLTVKFFPNMHYTFRIFSVTSKPRSSIVSVFQSMIWRPLM